MSEGPGPRRKSEPEALRAISAARAEPLPEAPQGPLSARLKEGAADTALNVVGILRDLWGDFQSRDVFFKYKALVLGAWVVLSAAGLLVACPGGGGPSNTIDARLVRTKVLDSPVLMIVNESGEPWEDVVVVVNHAYRAAVARVGHEPPDNNLTLEPKKLLGEGGRPAPADLKILDVEVRTADGRARLMEGGLELE